MTISLTDIEIQRIISACGQYIELMEQNEDTYEYTLYEIETGLGSALRKICKGKKTRRTWAKFYTFKHKNNR